MDKISVAVLTESRADWGGIEPVLDELMSRGDKVDTAIFSLNNGAPAWIRDDLRDYRYVSHKGIRPRLGRDVCDYNWLICLGDRPRVLKAIINELEKWQTISIAHLSGGDKQNGHLVDEPCRHAISKFAHLHFPCTQESASRLVRQGEDPNRIHVVGSTMVDKLRDFVPTCNLKDFYLCLIHPSPAWIYYYRKVQTEIDGAIFAMPNSDYGAGVPSNVILLENTDRSKFLRLLWGCKAFIGNSSAMYLEAQYIGTPCVQLGTRNLGRQEAFPGHVQVCHDDENLNDAVAKAIERDARTETGLRENWQDGAHGDGTAAKKIVDVLLKIGNPTENFLRKEWL